MVRRQAASALLVVGALALAGLADVGHVVGPGETLGAIARRYNTTPQALVKANHIADPDLILLGSQLRIPTPTPSPTPGPAPPGAAPLIPPVIPRAIPRVAPNVTYTVKAGDNLTGIAARFDVSATAVGSLNGISRPNMIRIGQVINIPVPSPAAVEALLIRFSKLYKVDTALIEALAWQESGWQQQVVSDVGAVGVMQLMPGTGRFTGQILLQRSVDPAILERNVEAGVAFFAYLLRLTAGNQPLAVAAYYQGLRSVTTKGVFEDTKRYVADVMALKQRFLA